MSKELEDLVGSNFIQRTDVKAIQRGDVYHPHTTTGKRNGERIGWDRQAIRDHIEGRVSYGHYLVDQQGMSKLFAFDIDLAKADEEHDKTFHWVGIEPDGTWTDMEPRKFDPRAAWQHPKCPDNLRRYMTAQLMHTAELFAGIIDDLIGVPIAISYSGAKGIHVYGLTGTAPAEDCRDAAIEVIKFTNEYKTIRGECFYGPQETHHRARSSCVEIEIFPKQGNLEGKDLGNLMRLPLGENAKGGRSYFLSLNSPVDEMKELDAVDALKAGDPWQ